MQRIFILFLVLSGLFGASACALLKKKQKPTEIQPIPLASIAKQLADPSPLPVLLMVGKDKQLTIGLLSRGYNLIQVIDEENQTDFRAEFAEFSDTRLRLTDFMQGKIGENSPYSGIIMDETQIGRPIWIKQNEDMLLNLWTRLEKGSSLFYFHYTEAASQYGKKESSLLKDQFIEFGNTRFKQYQIDSTAIPGIHVLKFTK